MFVQEEATIHCERNEDSCVDNNKSCVKEGRHVKMIRVESERHASALLEHPRTFLSGVPPPLRKVYPDATQELVPASIVEQLTLLPAITVTSFVSSNGVYEEGGLLGSTFPGVAKAGVHICLPPGREYVSAVNAFQTFCNKVILLRRLSSVR